MLFLLHEAARVGRGDLAPITIASHRQILDQVWRPQIGTMALLAMRYSTPHPLEDRAFARRTESIITD
jgi:hypothetical protein